MKTNKSEGKLTADAHDLNSEKFYHGTKSDLKQGDLIEPGFNSNYGTRKRASFVYLTATLDAAIWELNLPKAKE